MRTIFRPRRAGKTTEIIKLAAEHFSYIVCINQAEVDRVFAQARKMKLDIPFPITMDEFIEGRFHPLGIKSFVIDNAEFILERLARNVPLKAISITKNPEIAE